MVKKPWFFVGIITIVVIVGGIVVLEINKQPKAVSGPIKTISTQSNKSKGTTSNTNSTATAAANSSKVAATADNQATSSGGPTAPYGSLVSNHKPGQNGSNLTELSQCTTTSGATCYVKFTQNGIVKTLPKQTVDSSGTTYWEWNVNDAGLTSGNWTITAVATLNGQTKTTTDQLTLEVQ